MLYMLDFGHGGSDPGAIGPRGTRESDINMVVGKQVGKLLIGQGNSVMYSRITDVFIGLMERTDMANKRKADFFISFHENSVENSTTNGTEVFCYAKGGAAEKMAVAIQKELVAALGLHDRSVKTANFSVIRESKMPAALIEASFISNPAQEIKLMDPTYRDKMALAIAKGIVRGSGKPWKELQAPKVTPPAAASKPLYTIQAGAFNTKAGADAALIKLKKAGIDAFIK